MKKYIVGALAVLSANAQAQTTLGAGELKISGFVDFRLNSYTIKDMPTAQPTNAESAFALDDGALYLNYDVGPLSLVVDVPWRRTKNADVDATANPPEASPNGNMFLGAEKAQAYGRYKTSDHLTLQAGQFDTPFGVEVNDSKDRFFNKTGLIYDNFLPVVHSGFLAEVTWEGFMFRGLSANPNNKGSLGTSATGDENYEYAALASWSGGAYRAQVGYLTRPINKADSSSGGSRNLLDVTAGATVAGFSVDVEYSSLKDDSKNLLTPGDSADSEDPATGFLAIVSYQFNESIAAGLRYETVDKLAFGGNFAGMSKADSYGASVHYTVSPALQLRTEFVNYEYKDSASQKATAERFSLATLFKF